MCEQIQDKLLFNDVIYSISRISLYRKKRSRSDPRFEFIPRNRHSTGDADGYHSEWEIVDNHLILRRIIASETTECNPPYLASWFCGTILISAGDKFYLDWQYAMVRRYTELTLHFRHGKLVEQSIIDKTAEIERLRAQNKDLFGEQLKDGKVHLI